MTYIVAVACVMGIAVGQILFKLGADLARTSGTWLEPRALLTLALALALYGFTTLAWIWVLQKVELGRVYPFMAMAFVLVPFASYLVFGERFTAQYFFGISLIVVGIVLTVRS